MTKKNEPLVSCLMVTTGPWAGGGFFKKNIRCYAAQTYPNKELLIIADDLPPEIEKQIMTHVNHLGREDIRCLFFDGKYGEGELRNIGLNDARGEILCQWDSNSLSHPARIRAQLGRLLHQKQGAVYLQKILRYFAPTREIFCLDYAREEHLCYLPTLMCFRDDRLRYPERGSMPGFLLNKNIFCQLGEIGGVGVTTDMPCQYVDVIERTAADNSRKEALFYSRPASEIGRSKLSVLRALQALDLGPKSVRVMSNRGQAYLHAPK